MIKKEEFEIEKNWLLIILGIFFIVFLINFIMGADPVSPDDLVINNNMTKAAASSQMVNISGGYVSNMTLTATVQNPRWKAFVGQVTGSFTLDDATGSTIYDWTLSSVTGRIYSTRTSGSVTWANINCSNNSLIEQENINLNHSNSDDNITATFNDTTHNTFWVGSVSIPANSCPTLNTYKSDAVQDTDFEEMVLYDGTNTVYATILEEDMTGFNDENYDFQMIVPEVGLPSFSGATAYYMYVEIGT